MFLFYGRMRRSAFLQLLILCIGSAVGGGGGDTAAVAAVGG